jgi:hypothetical protein
MPAARSVAEIKNRLWQELALKAELINEGVAITQEALDLIQPGVIAQEQVHSLFEMDFDTHDFELPSGYDLPNGLSVGFRWNKRSNNVITADGGRTILVTDGLAHGEVKFHRRPGWYGKKTSDGQDMSTVGVLYRNRALFVAYSNECSYKVKGEDCLFCNINSTKDTYGEKRGIFWKTAGQIGETAAAAYKEGLIDHLTISGGVIPERRELDYYLDVAEAIQEHTGLQDFNGTAVVAAPLDLRHIDRFKEAGYRTTAMNIELWDKNMYDTICPGKSRGGGGWEHWVKALNYAVGVFGRGNVRSNMVAGIEPKKKTVEGIHIMTEAGIVATATIWCPNPGSELEGHRAPESGWYLDLAHTIAGAWRKAGFTWQQVCDCNASNDTLQHDIWRIQDETLPVFAEAGTRLAEQAA